MRLLVSLLLLALVACSSDKEAPVCEGGCACEADVDCGSGLCDVAAGRCLPEETAVVAELPGDPSGRSFGVLDFGEVAVGGWATLEIPLRNDAPIALDAEVAGLAAPFFVDGDVRVVLAPGEQGVLRIRFAPGTQGLHETLVQLRSHRTAWSVRLTGWGVVPALACPESLVFPDAPAGPRAEEVVCRNTGGVAARLVPTVTGGAFAVEPAGLLEVGGEQDVRVTVSYDPDAPGTHEGALRFDTLLGETVATVALRVGASTGAPQLRCDPAALDFGRRALGTAATLGLTCTNAGDAALVIEAATASPPEISAVVPTGPQAPGATFELPVVWTPERAGAFAGQVVLATNDASRPTLEIPVRGDAVDTSGCSLELDPPAFDFGKLSPGRSATVDLQVRNVGTTECLVDAALQRGSAFSIGALDRSLAAGAVAALPVTFAPPREGPFTGWLEVNATEPGHPVPRAVSLFGEGAAACIVWDPPSLEVGPALPGCSSRPAWAFARNVCGEPVLVSAANMVGPSGWAAETPMPVGMAPGSAVVVLVVHRPDGSAVPGVERAAVRLSGHAVPVAELLPVTGIVTDGPATEAFTSEPVPLDVLWVVGVGPGLDAARAQLARHAASFAASAPETTKLRMAVTPGGGSRAGRLAGGAWVDPASPTFAEDWEAALAAVPATGEDMPLEAAARFLQANQLPLGHQLAIVFVTDRADFSPQSLAYYRSQYAMYTGHLTLHAIDGGATGCGTTPPSAWPAEAIPTAFPVCTEDWSAQLGLLGADAAARPAIFYLRGTPADVDASGRIDEVRDGLEVAIDGTVVHPVDGRGSAVWHYDPTNDAIVFEPLQVPEPGSVVEVRYQVACLP